MAQQFGALLQLLLLARLKGGAVEFGMLEPQEILVLACLLAALLESRILMLGVHVSVESLSALPQQRAILRHNVHHIELEIFLLQQQVLVLAMNIHQLLAQFAQGREPHRRVVDEGAAFSAGAHLTPQDAVVGIIVDVVLCEEILHVVV